MHERNAISVRRTSGLAPIAAAVCALYGLTSAVAHAAPAVNNVANCNDAGSGSLRDTIANAAEGDIVDFGGLSNCTISVTTGAIAIPQADLTIHGNPDVPIDGSGNAAGNPLFVQDTGGGVLYIQNVTMGHNHNTSLLGEGGCIRTAGSIAIYYSSITDCVVQGTGPGAAGGAIAASGYVSLNHVSVSACEANPASEKVAYGGAIATNDRFFANYSTVSGNAADRHGTGYGFGGGVFAKKGVQLIHTTIASNTASFFVGGVFDTGGPQVYLSESTISGNSSPNFGGMYVFDVPAVQIDNSTIAFNRSLLSTGTQPGLMVGVGRTDRTSVVVKMRSSILSNNYIGPYQWDFATGEDVGFTVTFDATSSNNLIRQAFETPVPGDTSSACPLLGPLRDNGGFSPTHALYSGSPAIDAGSNPSMDIRDQRFYDLNANREFPRESPTGLPDIGAYEVDKSEIIFSAGNEGCMPLSAPG